MKANRFNPDHKEDNVPDWYFQNLTTDEEFETDNEALAWQKFNECQFPCELYCFGELMGDKEFEEDEITGTYTLVEQNYTGSEYADINDLEEIEV